MGKGVVGLAVTVKYVVVVVVVLAPLGTEVLHAIPCLLGIYLG